LPRRAAGLSGAAPVDEMRQAGVLGLAMQQLFLRWNQGQDLRQALITIALSVIVADQVVVHTGGGVAEDMSFPGRVNQFVDLHINGFSYSGARLFILGLALVIGVALWLFPRPDKSDLRYHPARAEAAYWLLTVGTACRVLGELLRPGIDAAWLRWVIMASGLLQIAGLVLFFWTMWSRIRAVGSQVREDKGERF